ncbi:DUF6887 family protein [Pannus brasiliensis]
MKPDFATMTKAQLRAYLLEHREDTEAFHALADRILDNPNLQWHTPEEIDRFPEIFREHPQKENSSSNK